MSGWDYYRVDDGPILKVDIDNRAMEYYKNIVNKELDAELIGVSTGKENNWKEIPKDQWSNYSVAKL